MFKEIIEQQKRTALVYEAVDEVLRMLGLAEKMFDEVCSTLLAEEKADVNVDQVDREINAGERLVRRLIFQHLTVNPQQDLPASLALLSIVHDVERIGDYAKNLLELKQWGSLSQGEGAATCGELHSMVTPLFAQTREALQDSNADLARQVMQRHEEVKKISDKIVAATMQDETGQDAVLQALASRFMRRVSAHLSNVASSVANPLDQLSGKVAVE